MVTNEGEGPDLRCTYAECAPAVAPGELQPLFETKSVTGRAIARRYAEAVPLHRIKTVRRSIIVVVHRVGVPSTAGGLKPIVDWPVVETIFEFANDIWSQACLQLALWPAPMVTTFRDLPVTGFFGYCLSPEDEKLLEPHDVVVPGKLIVNLYLAQHTNGAACGSPVTGHVIMPAVSGYAPRDVGRIFAHEIGHILLNRLGVDDSANPDHLMFHEEQHPGTPAGSGDGLFLSECFGANTWARQEFALLWQDDDSCLMGPRLGNDLTVVIDESRQQ